MKRFGWLWLGLFIWQGAQAQLRMPDYQRVQMTNGAVLLLMERHDVPLIAVQVTIAGGALLDEPGQEGTASLLAQWLNKGANNLSAGAWAQSLAQAGATLTVSATLESTVIAGQFLSRDASLLVSKVTDVLRRPSFDDTTFADLRQRRIEELRAAKDGELAALLPMYAQAALFGSHAYARPVLGSEQSVAQISAAMARTQYQRYWGANRVVIAVAGDFDAATMQRLWRDALQDWPGASQALPVIKAARPGATHRVLLVDAPGATQSYFWLGNVGVTRTDPERVALHVANTLLGGRYTSLLNTELRIKSGLTYGARSQWRSYAQPGTWSMSSFTEVTSTRQAIDLALDTYTAWYARGMSAAELTSVQRYELGQYVLDYETAAQWAAHMARLEQDGLARDEVDEHAARIAKLDVPHLNRVIRQQFPAPRQLLLVIIGDAAKIRPQLKTQVSKYGAITEMPLSAPTFSLR